MAETATCTACSAGRATSFVGTGCAALFVTSTFLVLFVHQLAVTVCYTACLLAFLFRSTPMDPAAQVTRLLTDLKNGDPAAIDRLIPVVYDELRRLAAHYLRDEHAANTLQPTALVHEAYLKLVAQQMPDWESRSHFFGVAAHLMRQILVDHARRHRSLKRGAGQPAVPLDDVVAFAPGRSDDLVALDDALNALAAVDARKCKVVELRFFGGMSVEETARTLNVSVGTIGREQRLAEAWLHRELSRADT